MSRGVGVALFAAGCIAIGVVGFEFVDHGGWMPRDGSDHGRVILGASMMVWSAAFLAFLLISLWAYGSMRAIGRRRPDAVVVRSGGSPGLRRALDENGALRRMLARERLPFMQFAVVFDPKGIEIWHGSVQTGSLDRAVIARAGVGRTNDGVWPFTTIEVDVVTGDGRGTVPFVVRGRTGFLGARKAEAERIARQVGALYSLGT